MSHCIKHHVALLALAGLSTAPVAGLAQNFKAFPSVQILANQTGLAGTCAGTGFDINVFINSGPQTSAEVRLIDPNGFVIEQFTDDIGLNLPSSFNAVFTDYVVLPFNGALAPHSLLTLQISSYTGPALSGTRSYQSAMTFDCTSGALVDLQPMPPVPTLSGMALALLAAMIGVLATVPGLRRRARSERT